MSGRKGFNKEKELQLPTKFSTDTETAVFEDMESFINNSDMESLNDNSDMDGENHKELLLNVSHKFVICYGVEGMKFLRFLQNRKCIRIDCRLTWKC